MAPLMRREDGWSEGVGGAVPFQEARGRRRKTVYFGRLPETASRPLSIPAFRPSGPLPTLDGTSGIDGFSAKH